MLLKGYLSFFAGGFSLHLLNRIDNELQKFHWASCQAHQFETISIYIKFTTWRGKQIIFEFWHVAHAATCTCSSLGHQKVACHRHHSASFFLILAAHSCVFVYVFVFFVIPCHCCFVTLSILDARVCVLVCAGICVCFNIPHYCSSTIL